MTSESYVAAERQKYLNTWARPEYRKRSPGLIAVPEAIEAMSMEAPANVIDFGCGEGKAVQEFQKNGFKVHGVDLVASNIVSVQNLGFTNTITFETCALHEMQPFAFPFDYGFSCDVLEHIAKPYIVPSLECMKARVKGPMFLQVAHFPDHGWGTGDLHLTVEDPEWWKQRFASIFMKVRQVGSEGKDRRTSWVVE